MKVSGIWKTLLFFAIFVPCAFLLFFKATEFSIKNITMDLPYNSEWEIPPLKLEEQQKLNAILSQKYQYLGKGNQVYAFESMDGQYVIKFFKFGHLKPSFFSKNPDVKLKKLQRVFSSHKLAYDLDKDNAALMFIHLNKTTGPAQMIEVSDLFGMTHHIDLNQVVYIAQKKTVPTRKVISRLLDEGNRVEAIKHFQSLLKMFVSEYSRGIYDQDRNLMHNTGFIGEQPIRFDVGKMAQDEGMKNPEVYQDDLDKIVNKRIYYWLNKYYPKYAEEILNNLKEFTKAQT